MPENKLMSHNTISLLYVEDEATTRERVSRVLVSRGYKLFIAQDGEKGLAEFREHAPDIVLTDIMMPHLNGLEMAREIRTLVPDVQIACMTAFSDTGNLIEAINIGVDQFVLKPVEFDRLFAALDRCQKMVELQKRQRILEAENLQAKKIEAIGILAGGMAHDFNNMLQVILGYVSLARMNEEPGSKTDTLLAIAETTSEKARELGQRLLTFAKGGDSVMKPTPPGHLIKETVKSRLNLFPAIKAVIDLPDDLPLVMADTDQIQQMVASLVENAGEAMPHGGLLHISAAPVSLAMVNDFGLPPGEYLHVIFADSGIGIPPENMPKIFDPYFSTKEIGCQKGMGLGLALCYSFIKHHKGHIHAESELGKGTSIHVHLPVFHPVN